MMGVYLHGLAGNLALKNKTNYNITASDQIQHIANAFKKYCPDYLFIFLFAFTLLFSQSCNTASKVQATQVVIAPRNNSPVEKLSTKTIAINDTQKLI